MSLNTRWIALVGVTAFAIVLAVILGTHLSGQAAWFAFALAVGVVSGVASGIASSLLVSGSRQPKKQTTYNDPDQVSATIPLTPDQADVLVKLLGRPQVQPGSFSLRSPSGRRFSAVGGAELTDEVDSSTDET
jgi:hypothetical protein